MNRTRSVISVEAPPSARAAQPLRAEALIGEATRRT